jgi:Fe-S-cluster containining protein
VQHYNDSDLIKDALDLLSRKWKIHPKLYDFQMGRYKDVVDTPVTVGGVIFHIPTLSKDGLFVLWKCLWPDCHNCCERQGRLPLTKDDIIKVAKKVGYGSNAEFVRNETTISSWHEQEAFGNVITTLSMISLKRKQDEKPEEDGMPLRCRFLDDKGYCSIHPDKPGVCWLYPFASWLEVDPSGQPVVHATFQFTGDCPGFYLETSMDSMLPVLEEYSRKIYDYNMAVSRTTRENYGFVNFTDLRKI